MNPSICSMTLIRQVQCPKRMQFATLWPVRSRGFTSPEFDVRRLRIAIIECPRYSDNA
jgi:hypothetical protein